MRVCANMCLVANLSRFVSNLRQLHEHKHKYNYINENAEATKSLIHVCTNDALKNAKRISCFFRTNSFHLYMDKWPSSLIK